MVVNSVLCIKNQTATGDEPRKQDTQANKESSPRNFSITLMLDQTQLKEFGNDLRLHLFLLVGSFEHPFQVRTSVATSGHVFGRRRVRRAVGALLCGSPWWW